MGEPSGADAFPWVMHSPHACIPDAPVAAPARPGGGRAAGRADPARQRGGLRGRVRASRPGILGFCRHMLGSREEAEDAVQQTFAAAYRDLLRDGEREITLKPWLFAIARNRCLSMLRARRERPAEIRSSHRGPGRAGRHAGRPAPAARRPARAARGAARRAAARRGGDPSHAEVAGVLDCEVRA